MRNFLATFSTGATAFVSAGFLVYAMMSGNGGMQFGQDEWRKAKENGVDVVNGVVQPASQIVRDSVLDDILTSAIEKTRETESPSLQTGVQGSSELSVLDIIKKNADVVPSVSGQNRISVTVKPGDTLYGISKKYGLGVDQLARLNGLEEPYVIKLGQNLYIAR